MKIIHLTKYRLHRFFYSPRPVIPLIISVCYMRLMYSVRPMDVCSGLVMAGIVQFIMMTFVSLTVSGSEETVDEQLLLFHGNNWGTYCIARELSYIIISCIFGLFFAIQPVIINCFNGFSFFFRPVTAGDVILGGLIIIVSGMAGIAIGDLFHPRIMKDRNLAIGIVVIVLICSIVKDSIIAKHGFLTPFMILFPPVMKPSHDFGDVDLFDVKSVLYFITLMMVYYLIIVAIKNALLIRKKFS